MLNNSNVSQLYYAIKVNGSIVSIKYTDRAAASLHLMQLPKETQVIAEIVTLDNSGRELLLG